jgi:hypothetical protein
MQTIKICDTHDNLLTIVTIKPIVPSDLMLDVINPSVVAPTFLQPVIRSLTLGHPRTLKIDSKPYLVFDY